MRDGQDEHAPLSPQPEPQSLTAHGLFGNYVGAGAQAGCVRQLCAPAARQRKGARGRACSLRTVAGRLGQSGNSAAPHLHFQLSNAVAFEGSEGLPFGFDRFDLLGPETEAQLFGQDKPWTPATPQHRQAQLPLDDVVIGFPASR